MMQKQEDHHNIEARLVDKMSSKLARFSSEVKLCSNQSKNKNKSFGHNLNWNQILEGKE